MISCQEAMYTMSLFHPWQRTLEYIVLGVAPSAKLTVSNRDDEVVSGERLRHARRVSLDLCHHE